MKFLTKFLFVALFATALISNGCKTENPQPDQWAAAKADCAGKNNPNYSYSWNDVYHRCDSVYVGVVINDTTRLTQSDFAIWDNNLTSANTLLAQGKFVELKFVKHQLYSILSQASENLTLQKSLKETHGDRFIINYNGKTLALANADTEVPPYALYESWKPTNFQNVMLGDTLHKMPVPIAEYNLFVADGVPGSIFKKIWNEYIINNPGDAAGFPAWLANQFSIGADSAKVQYKNQHILNETDYSAVYDAYTAAQNPRVIKYYVNYSNAPFARQEYTPTMYNRGIDPISINPNGAKWFVKIDSVRFMQENCVNPSSYDIEYNTLPTQQIANGADMAALVAYVRQNYNSGTGKIPAEFTASFNLLTQANADAATAVVGQITGDSLELNTNGNTFVPGQNKILNMPKNALDAYNNRSALGQTYVNRSTGNWLTDNPGNGITGQFLVAETGNSSGLNANVLFRNIVADGPIPINLLVAAINGGFFNPGDEQINITPNGNHCDYMNQTGIENISTPAAYDSTKPIQFTTDPKVGLYNPNSYTDINGIDLQVLDNRIIVILNASQNIAGSGQKIVKKAYAPVTMNLTVPTNYMTDNGGIVFSRPYFHFDLTQGIFFTPVNYLSSSKINYPDNSVAVDHETCNYWGYQGTNGMIAYQNDAGVSGNNMSLVCDTPAGKSAVTLQTILDLWQGQSPSSVPARAPQRKVVPVKSQEVRQYIQKIKTAQKR